MTHSYFGEHQLGAPVKQIDAKNHNPPQVTDYKGCKVHAKKGVVSGNTENWLIFNMDTKPENLLNAAPTDWNDVTTASGASHVFLVRAGREHHAVVLGAQPALFPVRFRHPGGCFPKG